MFDKIHIKDELSWTSIITGYARNDDLDSARQIFEGMTKKSVVAWNSRISSYIHHGFLLQALLMFKKTNNLGLGGMSLHRLSLPSACANAGFSSSEGYPTHWSKPAKDFSLSVDNALVTLYWECKVKEALKVFQGNVNEKPCFMECKIICIC